MNGSSKEICPQSRCTELQLVANHEHLDPETYRWKPGPNDALELSQQAKDIADVILSSYDGLTLEQREAEDMYEFTSALHSTILDVRLTFA